MQSQNQLIQKLIAKDRSSLNELYDTYIHHVSRILSNSDTPQSDHEEIITKLFTQIWTSPQILYKEKHLSIAITKLCLKLTNTHCSRIS